MGGTRRLSLTRPSRLLLCPPTGRRSARAHLSGGHLCGAAQVQGAPCVSSPKHAASASVWATPAQRRLPRWWLSRPFSDANACFAQSLSVGTKLWGVVVEVNARRLTVGLPSGLRGVVRASEVRVANQRAGRSPGSHACSDNLPYSAQTSDVYAERSAAAALPEEDGGSDSVDASGGG